MTPEQIEKVIAAVRQEVDARLEAKGTAATQFDRPRLDALGKELIESVRGYVARNVQPLYDRIKTLETELAALKARS